MQELIDRIEQLERSVRRWRTAALLLAAVLVSLFSGAGFLAVQHAHVVRAVEEARQQELVARALAEAERARAVRQLEAVREVQQRKE